jgi:hypothetical protein
MGFGIERAGWILFGILNTPFSSENDLVRLMRRSLILHFSTLYYGISSKVGALGGPAQDS